MVDGRQEIAFVEIGVSQAVEGRSGLSRALDVGLSQLFQIAGDRFVRVLVPRRAALVLLEPAQKTRSLVRGS
jgi:hypothetical protein